MARTRSMSDGLSLLCMVEEPYGALAIVSSRCCKGIEQLAFPLDRGCLTILWDHVLKYFAPGLKTHSFSYDRLPYTCPVRDTSAEMTDTSPPDQNLPIQGRF